VRPPRDWGFGAVRVDRRFISTNVVVKPSDWGVGAVRVDRRFISTNVVVKPSDWGFGGVHRRPINDDL